MHDVAKMLKLIHENWYLISISEGSETQFSGNDFLAPALRGYVSHLLVSEKLSFTSS